MAEESRLKHLLGGRFGSKRDPGTGPEEAREPESRPERAETREVETTETPGHEEAAGSEDSGEERSTGGDSEKGIDISGTPAPSIGAKTVITKEPPEERLARHEQSTKDAMGLDKRREISGGSYGPSFARQAISYGAALAVLAAIVIGTVLLVGKLDQAPDRYADKAPWSKADVQQRDPPPLQ